MLEIVQKKLNSVGREAAGRGRLVEVDGIYFVPKVNKKGLLLVLTLNLLSLSWTSFRCFSISLAEDYSIKLIYSARKLKNILKCANPHLLTQYTTSIFVIIIISIHPICVKYVSPFWLCHLH